VPDELTKLPKLFLALAGKAHDEGRADGDVRHDLAHTPDHLQIGSRIAAAAHRRQDRPRDVLKWNVDIWNKSRLASHEIQCRIVPALGIGVQKSDPGKGSLRDQPLDEPRQAFAAETDVLAVPRRVLRDQNELRNALRGYRIRFGDQRLDRAASLQPAHLRNRA